MHKLKHYVEKFYDGFFVSESSVEEIEERSKALFKIGETCYGFRFFDKSIAVIDDETLIGERKNVSGMHYPDGKKYTLNDVKRYHPTMKTLISNMEHGSIECAVYTRTGFWQQFYSDDIVL